MLLFTTRESDLRITMMKSTNLSNASCRHTGGSSGNIIAADDANTHSRMAHLRQSLAKVIPLWKHIIIFQVYSEELFDQAYFDNNFKHHA